MLRHPFGRPTYSARTDPRGKSSNTPLQKTFVALLHVGGFHTYILSSTKRESFGKLREKEGRCQATDNRVMPQATFRMLDNLWHLMTIEAYDEIPCLTHGNCVRLKG